MMYRQRTQILFQLELRKPTWMWDDVAPDPAGITESVQQSSSKHRQDANEASPTKLRWSGECHRESIFSHVEDILSRWSVKYGQSCMMLYVYLQSVLQRHETVTVRVVL
jgi:hypothetical protein